MSNVIDPLQEDWLESIQKSLELNINSKIQSDGKFYAYLLFDCAQNMETYSSIISSKLPYKSLFESKSGATEETLKLSPILVQVDIHQPNYWQDLVLACSGLPMVNLLISKETLPYLKNRLIKYATVVQDNQFYNVRYVDTRRLKNFYQLLPDEDKNIWLNGIEQWYFINRKGSWEALLSGAVKFIDSKVIEPISERDNFFEFEERYFNLFVEKSEADNILYYIFEENPSLFKGMKKSHAYDLVQKGLEVSDKHYLVVHAERQKCCELILENPENASLLSSIPDSHPNISKLKLWVKLKREPTEQEFRKFFYG